MAWGWGAAPRPAPAAAAAPSSRWEGVWERHHRVREVLLGALLGLGLGPQRLARLLGLVRRPLLRGYGQRPRVEGRVLGQVVAVRPLGQPEAPARHGATHLCRGSRAPNAGFRFAAGLRGNAKALCKNKEKVVGNRSTPAPRWYGCGAWCQTWLERCTPQRAPNPGAQAAPPTRTGDTYLGDTARLGGRGLGRPAAGRALVEVGRPRNELDQALLGRPHFARRRRLVARGRRQRRGTHGRAGVRRRGRGARVVKAVGDGGRPGGLAPLLLVGEELGLGLAPVVLGHDLLEDGRRLPLEPRLDVHEGVLRRRQPLVPVAQPPHGELQGLALSGPQGLASAAAAAAASWGAVAFP